MPAASSRRDLDDLLRWREEGRKVTADLARERLEAAKETVELHGLPRPEISRMADWMIGQMTGGRNQATEKSTGNG